MPHIFISYSHADSAYAHKLAEKLKQEGFSVWIDNRISYGAVWPREIQERLDACAAFIVIMTPHSYESDWVQNELVRAQSRKKLIFPMLLEGDESWLAVQTMRYVDVKNGDLPQADFYKNLAEAAPQAAINRQRPPQKVTLHRIRSGKVFISKSSGAHAAHFDNDEPRNNMEVQAIASFAQAVEDDADVTSWGGIADRIRAEQYLTNKIEELEALGLHVYIGLAKGNLVTEKGVLDDWQVLYVVVSRQETETLIFISTR